ncbi:hypothetical protein RCZ15_19330 [Capnocytophaga catalasegens]|uniref:Hemagglutinin n=1 Tax=Capnocytophaga catalasegens TaxID=1004260 RepID=A0AAV5AYJ4_9FLAO|nr:hypothetical protein RCZ03_13720 [Capnocytophaga catalasegens]GJM50960.1 hypothetical protein RCZ15_19330 [Capnocytophaga catalasegens]GJM52144.1 hypothetical protein RCZ16_04620 [Capnocytophaga catalasegens]
MEEILKIKEARFSKLNHEEYTHFIRSAERLILTATPEKLGVSEDIVNEFSANIEKLTQVIRHSRVSNETAEMTKLDKQRDDVAVYLLTIVRNERKTPIEAKQKAAMALYNITKNYQGIQLLPKRRETQAIDSLLSDLSTSENAAYIAKLSLTDVVNQLSKINKRYDELTAQRADNQLAQNVESAKKIRIKTTEQYDTIVMYAFASSIINPSNESKVFVMSLNKLIDDTNTAYKRRMSRIKKENN